MSMSTEPCCAAGVLFRRRRQSGKRSARRVGRQRAGLREAGFSGVALVDSQSDFNAYGKVEGQTGCCTAAGWAVAERPAACRATPAKTCLTIAGCSFCETSASQPSKTTVQRHLGRLMTGYDLNDFAAIVRVFAVKP